MSDIKNKEVCLLTGREVSYTQERLIHYDLTIADNEVTVFICNNCFSELKKIEIPYHIFSGLIANNRFPERVFVGLKKGLHTCDRSSLPVNSESIFLPEFIETAIYPKTPKDKET